MVKQEIHPTAVIEEGAQLGEGVRIEPYAIIKKNVVLHDHVVVKAHAYIDGHTTIGEETVIWPSAVIGTQTQDLKYNGEVTYVKIGKRCQIREYATINSSSEEGSVVHVGDDCLIMACCHVAHHCYVGNHVIMSNNSILAGHVTVEDFAILGGMTPVHQNVRIGAHAMVGGMSRVAHDVPPYTLGGGIPYEMGGINRVGLKRRGFSQEVRRALFTAFQILYRSELSVEEALLEIEATVHPYDEVEHFVKFCRGSKRGLIGSRGSRRSSIPSSDEQNEEKLQEVEV
jgi:UDP-N-acetylglucosamine acyltransferase